jgi:hypothetical protein
MEDTTEITMIDPGIRVSDIWWVLTQEEDVDVAKGLAERGEKRREGGMGHGTKDEKKKKDI